MIPAVIGAFIGVTVAFCAIEAVYHLSGAHFMSEGFWKNAFLVAAIATLCAMGQIAVLLISDGDPRHSMGYPIWILTVLVASGAIKVLRMNDIDSEVDYAVASTIPGFGLIASAFMEMLA